MDNLYYLLVATNLFFVLLVFTIFLKVPKSKTRIAFLVFCVSALCYANLVIFLRFPAHGLEQRLLLSKIILSMGLAMGLSYFRFNTGFSGFKVSRTYELVGYALIAISLLCTWSGGIMIRIEQETDSIQYSPLFLIYFATWLFLILAPNVTLYLSLKSSRDDPVFHAQTIRLLAINSITCGIVLITNFAMPYFFGVKQVGILGALSVVMYFGYTIYILTEGKYIAFKASFKEAVDVALLNNGSNKLLGFLGQVKTSLLNNADLNSLIQSQPEKNLVETLASQNLAFTFESTFLDAKVSNGHFLKVINDICHQNLQYQKENLHLRLQYETTQRHLRGIETAQASGADWSPLEIAENKVIEQVLQKNNYNGSRTAKELRITVNTLKSKSQKYGIKMKKSGAD